MFNIALTYDIITRTTNQYHYGEQRWTGKEAGTPGAARRPRPPCAVDSEVRRLLLGAPPTTQEQSPRSKRKVRNAMNELRDAARWAFQYFEAMDRANAQIHCAPVRYSPITFRLQRALGDVWPEDEDITEEMQWVRSHDGTYPEDPGR